MTSSGQEQDAFASTRIISGVGSKCLAVLAAILVMQLIVAIIKRRHRHRTFERMQIDGPKPSLISGSLYDTRRQPYIKFAHKMHETYGKNVGMYMGGDPYLMTKDLDLIQQVFVAKSRTFYDRMNFYFNIDPVPDNLICQRGDRWRYMRKLLTPAFSHSKIKSSDQFYRDTQQTVTKFMLQIEENSQLVKSSGVNALDEDGAQKVRGKTKETLVEDTYDRMAALALDVIVKTAFHMDNVISFAGPLCNQQEIANEKQQQINRDQVKGKQIISARKSYSKSWRKPDAFLDTAKQACRLAFNPLVELLFCLPFLDLPFTFLCNQVYFGKILQLLYNRLDYLVRRSNFPKSEGSSTTNKQANGKTQPSTDKDNQASNAQLQRRIIDDLIQVLREKKINMNEFRGNAFVIVFAGFETTANALTFTLWLLAKYQQVQEKLRSKLQSLIKENKFEDEKSMDEQQFADLAFNCEYLEMVINESLRLYPPVPGLSCRQASESCTLSNGLQIEKGVNVVPSVFSIHRDKTIWGDSANSFKPERFEVLDVAKLNSAMFMPFGLGPRNCIGKAVAMHELKIVLAKLLLNYEIKPWAGRTPEKLKLCSPINITITNADKIGLRFVKLIN